MDVGGRKVVGERHRGKELGLTSGWFLLGVLCP